VITPGFHWLTQLICLCPLHVIGQSDYFDFDFEALNWLMLFDSVSLCNERFPIECLESNQAITLVFVYVLPQFEVG